MQNQTTWYIVSGIAIGATILLFLAAMVVYFIIQYQQKQHQNKTNTIQMQQSFQEELLLTRAEVKEQTLQTIAADLHDNIGQLLSITNATLSSVNLNDRQKSEQKIKDAIGFVNTSIKDLRQLAKLLQAENLLQQGLMQAIEQEMQWMEKHGQYAVTYVQKIDNTYLPNAKKDLIAFRLLQETLNNIIKHARATAIHCELHFQQQVLHLAVSDNGSGFALSHVDNTAAGLGITNMKKRTALVGGTIEFSSEPDRGTTIYITIPYEQTS
ncbi:MAG: ATP-binding protein [Sediminibacterium sp.]|nr:ATP-binding protein [Sediminibacterium sp.]